jgi:hypothetical protein
MADDVFCKWERGRFPRDEFEVRGPAHVHVSAGTPLHTSAGRLLERDSLDYADGRSDDGDGDGDGGYSGESDRSTEP